MSTTACCLFRVLLSLVALLDAFWTSCFASRFFSSLLFSPVFAIWSSPIYDMVPNQRKTAVTGPLKRGQVWTDTVRMTWFSYGSCRSWTDCRIVPIFESSASLGSISNFNFLDFLTTLDLPIDGPPLNLLGAPVAKPGMALTPDLTGLGVNCLFLLTSLMIWAWIGMS